MMDFASTPAHAKGVAPTISHEEGRVESVVARPLKASPPPTTNGVDKMYRQLVEIHTITTAQLAECAWWHRSNPTPDMAHTGAGW
jgi:hypothetical protein